MKEVTLLACGPSLIRVLEDPSLVEGNVAVVNSAGVFWPGRIDFWFSLHPERVLSRWQARIKAGYNMDYITVVPKMGPRTREELSVIDKVYCTNKTFFNMGGSSSFYAIMMLSRILNYDRIYLFGVDLTNEYWKAYIKPWNTHASELKAKTLNYPCEKTRYITQGLPGIYHDVTTGPAYTNL